MLTNTIAYFSTKLGSRALQSLSGLFLCLPVYADSLCTPEEEIVALSRAMYFEDRSDETGMRAVGHVILNRYNDPRWPDSICGVVYQPSNDPSRPRKCAFSYSCDDIEDITLEVDRYKLAEKVAHRLISGYYHYDITLGSLYYYRCELDKTQKWMETLDFVVKFNLHCYFRD